MKPTTREVLHKALQIVHDEAEARDPGAGLCHSVTCVLRVIAPTSVTRIMAELRGMMLQWPERYTGGHRSDNESFPVGGQVEYVNEWAAGTMWDNPRRWDLLRYLLDRTASRPHSPS